MKEPWQYQLTITCRRHESYWTVDGLLQTEIGGPTVEGRRTETAPPEGAMYAAALRILCELEGVAELVLPDPALPR